MTGRAGSEQAQLLGCRRKVPDKLDDAPTWCDNSNDKLSRHLLRDVRLDSWDSGSNSRCLGLGTLSGLLWGPFPHMRRAAPRG